MDFICVMFKPNSSHVQLVTLFNMTVKKWFSRIGEHGVPKHVRTQLLIASIHVIFFRQSSRCIVFGQFTNQAHQDQVGTYKHKPLCIRCTHAKNRSIVYRSNKERV